ncbi:uncharacterized protein A1O9_10148 [Exophiala aquamarina CBS 119918]|uniref:Uncharacterized protein n=1 Tax=Exophiala aquamarina CBS 119918 TaxID=1182545 RepID=A0A072P240_9EURO|nr:uncharacterized protein A1O9_10148 [Exophiala aquamarina CBS 119918]KEF53747.1 hypothetical protein A1O9_10148 [Exophiala aquamarina CBS 119918]
MREATDEALQRLYWACRRGSGFPGPVPDESNGPPSTAAILDALALRPSIEDVGRLGDLQNGVNLSDPPDSLHEHSRRLSSAESPMKEEYLPSPPQSCLSKTSTVHRQNSDSSLATINHTAIVPATSPNMHMSEQLLQSPSRNESSHSNGITNRLGPPYTESSSSLSFDMDAYLDTNSCVMPFPSADPIGTMQNSAQLDISAMMENNHAFQPMDTASSKSSLIDEAYLSPWPGSLAAIYQIAGMAK